MDKQMPVFYVDTITTYPPEAIRSAQARRTSRNWCHLWTDGTPDDLHRFASFVGLRREWFQDKPGFPHYDLVPARRAKAIDLGAVEKPLAEWIRERMAAGKWHRGGLVPHEEKDDLPPALAKMPAPLIPRGDLRFGEPIRKGRATVRLGQNQQATLELFAARPQPLASRLQPLLLFASRFVERHARRGENFAEGMLALEGREQHLDEDLRERLESAVLEVMTTTLARCLPGNLDFACAAFYRSGHTENSHWEIVATLWNAKEHAAPRRPVGGAL